VWRALRGDANGSAQDVDAQFWRPAGRLRTRRPLPAGRARPRCTRTRTTAGEPLGTKPLTIAPQSPEMSEGGEEQRLLLRETAALRHCERCLRLLRLPRSSRTSRHHARDPLAPPRPGSSSTVAKESLNSLRKPVIRCCTPRPLFRRRAALRGPSVVAEAQDSASAEHRVEVLQRLGSPVECSPRRVRARSSAAGRPQTPPRKRHAHDALRR